MRINTATPRAQLMGKGFDPAFRRESWAGPRLALRGKPGARLTLQPGQAGDACSEVGDDQRDNQHH